MKNGFLLKQNDGLLKEASCSTHNSSLPTCIEQKHSQFCQIEKQLHRCQELAKAVNFITPLRSLLSETSSLI